MLIRASEQQVSGVIDSSRRPPSEACASRLASFGPSTGVSTGLRDSGAPPLHMRSEQPTTPLPLIVSRKRRLNKSHRKTTPCYALSQPTYRL
ncbi:unnamed protein product [Euphydryas editha]|uniref:Uncharacterized protein n=1 Tax=Euphydryas editha TaxID=104508 RepID=A0AAU9TY12_EUPED|nr:unnamed protein product [Euphydryas editha]